MPMILSFLMQPRDLLYASYSRNLAVFMREKMIKTRMERRLREMTMKVMKTIQRMTKVYHSVLSRARPDFYSMDAIKASFRSIIAKKIPETIIPRYSEKIKLFTEEFGKPDLHSRYIPEEFHLLIGNQSGYKSMLATIPIIDFVRLVNRNNVRDGFSQALCPQANTKQSYVMLSATVLAISLSKIIKTLTMENEIALIALMDNLDPELTGIFLTKKGRLSSNQNLWKARPNFLFRVLFPGINLKAKFVPANSLVTDGQTVNLLCYNVHKRNAAKKGSAAVRKYNAVPSNFKDGTLGHVLENAEIDSIDITDIRVVGAIPPSAVKSAFHHRKVDSEGLVGSNDVRTVNLPITEKELYSDGFFSAPCLERAKTLLHDRNVISFDPGTSVSGCAGLSFQFDEGGIISRTAVTKKLRGFGKSAFTGTTEHDGSGFEAGRVSSAADYEAYAEKFKERCRPIAEAKYRSVEGFRGVSAKKKATQRARADVVNLITATNDALNVSLSFVVLIL